MWSYSSSSKPIEHFCSNLGASSRNLIERNVNKRFHNVTCKRDEEVENNREVAVELDKLLFVLSSWHPRLSSLDF